MYSSGFSSNAFLHPGATVVIMGRRRYHSTIARFSPDATAKGERVLVAWCASQLSSCGDRCRRSLNLIQQCRRIRYIFGCIKHLDCHDTVIISKIHDQTVSNFILSIFRFLTYPIFIIFIIVIQLVMQAHPPKPIAKPPDVGT